MRMHKVFLGILVALAVVSIGSCRLFGRAKDFVWDTIQDVKVMAVIIAEDVIPEVAEDILNASVALIRGVQETASDVYVQLRGLDVSDDVDTSTKYAAVFFEDLNRNGAFDAAEPFHVESNGEKGFRLDRNASVIGSVKIVEGELQTTAYNLDVTYGITTSRGIDVTFNITADGAENVILHHSQDGWLPDHPASAYGDGQFTIFMNDLNPGPFAYKFQIDDDPVWYPDPNEPGYFPNPFTFWDDDNVDWNSAILLTDPGDIIPIEVQLVDLQGDPVDGNDVDYTVSYGPVEPFWLFDDNPFEVPLHENVESFPYTATVGAAAATVQLTAGQYYVVKVEDSRDAEAGAGYMEHRVYLYAHPQLDGGSFQAHLSRRADIDAVFTERGFTDPAGPTAAGYYDAVSRGFLLMNFTARDSVGDLVSELAPWYGNINFALYGLGTAKLPYTPESVGGTDADPWVYQILMADETASATDGDLGVYDDAYNMDFTDLTTAPYPENAWYYGYSQFIPESKVISRNDIQPELGIFLAPVSGFFFVEYSGLGHLVVIPRIATSAEASGVHQGYITAEVVAP